MLPVIDEMKNQIEHSVEMSAETLRLINRVKRSHNPMFLGVKPERTFKILMKEGEQSSNDPNKRRVRGGKKLNLANDYIDIVALGEGDPTTLMKRMKNIEETFMGNPAYHDPAFTRKKDHTKDEGDDKNATSDHFSNNRLMTPRMLKMTTNRDGRELL
mgnify:CR=1 FL=1